MASSAKSIRSNLEDEIRSVEVLTVKKGTSKKKKSLAAKG
jgi:hypothetical protein